MQIRVMEEEDISRVLQLRNWNIDEQSFKRYALFFPGESFVGEEAGAIVAHSATVNYGTCAWMGRIFLKERLRGKGLGLIFVSKVLAQLISQGVRTVCLESLEDKAPFFERAGFESISKTLSLKGTGTGSSTAAKELLPGELFEELCEFDKRHFKADRKKVLRLWWRDFPELTILKNDKGGAVEGYIMARKSPRGYTIGPCVAKPETSQALFGRILDALPLDVDVRVKVPAHNCRALELLRSFSFVDENVSTVRMRFGEETDIAEGPLICALGSHASG